MTNAYKNSSKYYDFIYLEKEGLDYEILVNDFLQLSQEVLGRKINSLFDIGCGTGTLAIKLAKRGIKVKGFDLSHEQIKFANEKIKEENLDIETFVGDMADFTLDEQFDAAGAFFSSFCYLLTNNQVLKFLNNMYSMINPGGVLYYEFWNTVGVKDASQHFLIRESEDLTLYRFNTTKVDYESGIVSMPMHHLVLKEKQVIDEFVENHELRSYTIPQMLSLINQTSWKVKEVFQDHMEMAKKEENQKNLILDSTLYYTNKKVNFNKY